MIRQVTILLRGMRTFRAFAAPDFPVIRHWLLALVCLTPFLLRADLDPRNAHTVAELPGDSTIQATICNNETYPFQGQLLNIAGTYTDTLTASDGTDSIVTLVLTVNPTAQTQIVASICAGETYDFNGLLADTTGDYTQVYSTQNGCDSTVTLTLTVLPVPVTNLTASICTGSEYLFAGDTLSASGTYTDTLTAANGCDSLVVLKLNVADFFEVNLQASICAGDAFIFGNDTLFAAGTYTDSLQAAGGCDSTIVLQLSVLPVFETLLESSICAGDTLIFGNDTLTTAGTYTRVLTAANGCDSTVVLQLSVLPNVATSVEASICAGETYPFNGLLLDTAGEYPVVLPAANGCDSTVTLTLTVLPVAATSLDAIICANETFEFDGELLDSAGVYTAVYSSANGCDSTVTLTLTVLPTASTKLEASICAGETYTFGGSTLDQSGEYTAVETAANGCDSTVVLTLTVLPLQSSTIEATICSNETYLFNGDTLYSAGDYLAVFTGLNGCDSTVTLSLAVLPAAGSTVDATICANENYPFNGAVYNQSGSYTATLEAANGCDSLVTLQLTVLPVAATSEEVRICAGSTYNYNGVELSDAGDYPFTFTAANGCDSVHTIQLRLLPVYNQQLNVSICAGATYIFDGQTLDASGVYSASYQTENGCDSTVTLNLSVVTFYVTELQGTACAGGFYEFGGAMLTTSGVYSDTLTSQGGCDSVLVLNLTVLPAIATEVNATICSNQSYPFNGSLYEETGVYTAYLTAANGCDSVITLYLTVLPAESSTLPATICAGETFEYGGAVLASPGVYTFTLVAANGCDSTVMVELNVLPSVETQREVTICNGQTYQFEGQSLTSAGTYTATFTSSTGCDSIITLNLTVLPSYQAFLNVSICAGENYQFGNQSIGTPGTYIQQGSTVAGCDSIVVLQLTVVENPAIVLEASTCNGEPYVYEGTLLQNSGTYNFEAIGPNGCPTLTTINLTVYPAIPVTEVEATICNGQAYVFNGETYNQAGVYTFELQATNGCDSVVVFTLNVTEINAQVSQVDETLVAVQTGATYQWYNCADFQAIPGATESTFTPTESGAYAVEITYNGCAVVSACTDVTIIGTREQALPLKWTLAPNPASGYTRLLIEEAADSDLLLELTGADGRVLQRQVLPAGAMSAQISMENMPSGVLFVRLSDGTGTATRRLIHQAD
jgi:hypothetical protein